MMAQNKNKKIEWHLALALWGSLSLLSIIGLLSGNDNVGIGMIIGIPMLYASWEDYTKNGGE